MVSQRSLLSGAPRLFTILFISFTLFLSLSRAADNDDSNSDDCTEENGCKVNGIEFTNADQAPECLYECSALQSFGQGKLPKCVTDQLTDPKYADVVAGGSWYDLDDADSKIIEDMMGCTCTDVDFIKGLAGCVFGDECGNNNTAIYEAINIGYKICGYAYNITFPAPTEVVKLLDITVSSGAIVPTTITGVPQATAWPGKSIPANAASSSASASASASTTATASTSTPTSSVALNSTNITTASTNAAMKTAPSYYLAILALFAFLALFTPSVAAQRNGTEVINSTATSGISIATDPPSLNRTTTATTVATATATGRSNITTTVGTPSATTTAPGSSDAPGSAIKNGASFGLVAAGAAVAAFLF